MKRGLSWAIKGCLKTVRAIFPWLDILIYSYSEGNEHRFSKAGISSDGSVK